ncbi:MAG: PRC-barrel domain containing protein [Flavobacterium sp.]|nr:MAG: PRC-barrel domain containing protein [Flavobacterium sp.]
MTNPNYRNLKSLQLSDDSPNPKQDVIGWEVKNEAGAYLGEVTDLLFDPKAMTVRYLVIDLTNNGMTLEDKKVMIPVGMATLHPSDDEIILPNIHLDQFIALPDYEQDVVNQHTEQQIWETLGSPAALRMEETIAEFDQEHFYSHDHFDETRFYNRNKADAHIDTTKTRVTEQHTIHELIENSLQHDLHAAAPETGTNTHHNEGKQIDQRTDDDNKWPKIT